MRDIFWGNLNWLFSLLAVAALGIGFFYLPPFWALFNAGILISLAILVFYDTLRANEAVRTLRLEQRRLASVINYTHEGIIAYDDNFKVLVFNRAAEEIFNLRAEDVVGKSFALSVRQQAIQKTNLLLTVLFPALAANIARRSAPGKYPQIIDLAFSDNNLELRVTTTPVVDSDGKTLGFLKVIQDRTRELNLLRTKSQFITIASHQLRTPLSGINRAMAGLAKEDLTAEQKELVASSIGAINRLQKIVNDLLDVAKIEEGNFGYQFQEQNLITFIENVLTQAKPTADHYQIKLYFEKPAEPEIKAMIDPQKLGMALTNLLDNALKYNIKNGQVTVNIKRLSDRPYLVISVSDTGIGMSEQSLQKLFSKFFRSENAVKAEVEGTGLGLYIAKNIIRRHGGDIGAQSTLNRGSVFTFTLPTDPALIPAHEYADEE